MKKLTFIFALAVFARGQDAISLKEAVRQSMARSKVIEASAAARDAASARVIEAKGGLLPNVNYSESWTRSDNPVFVFSSLLTQRQFIESNFDVTSLNRPGFLNSFQSLVTADQSLFDAGKPLFRWSFVGGVVVLLLASCALFYTGFVKVKILPFDNKSEFQVIVDMPNGTTLEQTARVVQLLGEETQKQPEVVNIQTYAGTASPYNFNGLVRHYYMRRGPNVADIQVNLLPKGGRDLQSHEIAKQVRLRLEPIAKRYGARIKVAEVPPGPPVLETLVAEVYGPAMDRRIELARRIRDLFKQTKGVVDVDWYVEDDQTKYALLVDEEKAALNGISEDDIARAMQVASTGYQAGLLHQDAEKEDVSLTVRLDRATRSDLERIQGLKIAGRNGRTVSLGELATPGFPSFPTALGNR